MGKGAKNIKKYLQEQKKTEEQKKYDRKITKIRLGVQEKQLERDIIFKLAQIESGEITETRTIHKLADGTMSIVDGFINNLKPKHILENEVDELKARVEMFKEQLIEIKKAEEEENVERTTSG